MERCGGVSGAYMRTELDGVTGTSSGFSKGTGVLLDITLYPSTLTVFASFSMAYTYFINCFLSFVLLGVVISSLLFHYILVLNPSWGVFRLPDKYLFGLLY